MFSEISTIAWLAIIVGAGFLVGRRLGSRVRGNGARNGNSPRAGGKYRAD